MKKIFLLFAFITIINPVILPQSFPDYEERNFTSLKDTSFLSKQLLTATEGSIDPDIYLLGPGDRIFISISGLEEIVVNLFINQEGNLYIPRVGGIDLKNKTLSQGKEEIIEAINRYYNNVEVFVTLVDFRKIKVSLLGNVKKPISLVLFANSRLIDAITNSEGLVKTSNYRNIKIISRDKKEKIYDLLNYLRFGDESNNPYLQEGDIIIVDKVDKVVSIYGEIKYPGIYEFVEGESVMGLLDLAGGYTNKAKKDTIEVISFDERGYNQISRYYAPNQLENNKIKLLNQDRVIIRQIPKFYLDRYVKVEGYVNYPGWYKIIEDSTSLKEIIYEAGGFLKDASLTEASLARTTGSVEYDPELERLKLLLRADMTDDEYDYLKAKSRERPGKVVVDFEKLFLKNDMSENIILKRGDVITIPEAKNYITLLGQVVIMKGLLLMII